MAIEIPEGLEPIQIRDGESIFIDLSMTITAENPTGIIPSTWIGDYKLTEFQKETTVVLTGVVEQSIDHLKFEVRIPYTGTDSLFGKFIISVKATDPITGFSQYIYENIVSIL